MVRKYSKSEKKADLHQGLWAPTLRLGALGQWVGAEFGQVSQFSERVGGGMVWVPG